MKQWYEELFENYAETYDKEVFTQGTLGEVDFIEQEMGYDKSKKILDIGCGTGRHAIELSARGYDVTGVDLSRSQLLRAIEKAKSRNLDISFTIADARHLDYQEEFDVVLLICEGAFSLMETDEMNYAILANAGKALKKHGKLILTTLNALFPLMHSTEKFLSENGLTTRDLKFDLLTCRENQTVEITNDLGIKKTIECTDRYYMPSEITWYLKQLDFKKIDIYGCKLGNFSRNDALTGSDFEMLVIAEK